MMARKKIVVANVLPNTALKEAIARLVFDEAIAEILEKDRHLIEAALVTDKRVASLDDEVRDALRQTGRGFPGVSTIIWVNPNAPDERSIAWLESGAPNEKSRTLG